MGRPLETILSLPRVRLINKVPVLEAERLVRLYLDEPKYRPSLIRHATKVTRDSYIQFSADESSLAYMLGEIETCEYTVTSSSRAALSDLLEGICSDGLIFKRFERAIRPLYEESMTLKRLSGMTGRVIDSALEYSYDIARLIGVRLREPEELINPL